MASQSDVASGLENLPSTEPLLLPAPIMQQFLSDTLSVCPFSVSFSVSSGWVTFRLSRGFPIPGFPHYETVTKLSDRGKDRDGMTSKQTTNLRQATRKAFFTVY
jgi:hypothetical protein